jgi:hypothetical protein
MMTEMVEKALLIAGRGDGPWCPVVDLKEIHVEGIGSGDEVCLESEHETLSRISTDGVHSVNLAEGKVRIRRTRGLENRITVRAFGAY